VRIRSSVAILFTLPLFWLMPVPSSAQSSQPTDNSVRERADALLRQMTVEEKAGQLNQASGITVKDAIKQVSDEAVVQGQVGSILWQVDVKEINRLQHVVVDRSRLHIPLLVGYDVIHGYRTVFPVPLAMASSWDPSVEEQAQRVAAEDSRAAGIQWTFAPMVDIARDARWGRIVEGAGEDPYLGRGHGAGSGAWISGAELSATSMLACVKHFPAMGQPTVAATMTRPTFPRCCCETCTCPLFMRR
jgi:beta-glucosidase